MSSKKQRERINISLRGIKGQVITSAAPYCPCLKRINARSIERLKKVEDPPA